MLRAWLRAARSGHDVPFVTVLSRDPIQWLSRFPDFRDLSWLDLCAGDVCEPNTLPMGRKFTHVLHAATDSTKGPALDPLRRFAQIVDGTRNVLEFSISAGAGRFLLTSSGAVYGTQPKVLDRIPETWLCGPSSLDATQTYGLAKRAAEHLCVLYGEAHGVDIVIARCFAFVGPDLPLNAHFAMGNFIRDALSSETIHVAGDGTALRSYLEQDDLARWLVALLENGTPGQAFNVGSDEAISVANLAHLVRDVLAPHKPVTIASRPQVDLVRNRYVPDISKARNEMGLSVTVDLAEAIRRVGSFHRDGVHA